MVCLPHDQDGQSRKHGKAREGNQTPKHVKVAGHAYPVTVGQLPAESLFR
jgi:hypothetical protein